MHKEFWLDRWKNRQIGFDQPAPNQLLVKHFNKLKLPKKAKVFVPLTGKSVDVIWLLSNDFKVVGCELSEQAIIELFQLLEIQPSITQWQHGVIYSTEDLTMFVGDFFDLKVTDLGIIDAVYDRASKVALPSDMRTKYAQHLTSITQFAPQLLIVFDYEQELVSGPPFSVTGMEINTNYGATYNISHIEEVQLPNGIKGGAPASENAWLLN